MRPRVVVRVGLDEREHSHHPSAVFVVAAERAGRQRAGPDLRDVGQATPAGPRTARPAGYAAALAGSGGWAGPAAVAPARPVAVSVMANLLRGCRRPSRSYSSAMIEPTRSASAGSRRFSKKP